MSTRNHSPSPNTPQFALQRFILTENVSNFSKIEANCVLADMVAKEKMAPQMYETLANAM